MVIASEWLAKIASFLADAAVLTAVVVAELVLAAIEARPAALVVVEDAAGKKHERQRCKDAFGGVHWEISGSSPRWLMDICGHLSCHA
jgi:hypothetical protein